MDEYDRSKQSAIYGLLMEELITLLTTEKGRRGNENTSVNDVAP